MSAPQPRWTAVRVAIAVAALYALILQSFIGGLALLPSITAGGVICAEHDGSTVPDGQGSACHQHACCVTAQAAKLLDPLGSAFATVHWLPVPVSSVPWPEAGTHRARAPPGQSVSPRGPPTV